VQAAIAREDDLDAAAEALREAGLQCVSADRRARRVIAAAPDGAEDLARALDALACESIEVDEADLHRPTLDDAFFALAGLPPATGAETSAAAADLMEARA
jgi:hypothetical protein